MGSNYLDLAALEGMLEDEEENRTEEYLFCEILKGKGGISSVREWVEKMAVKGDAVACCNLGYMYETGIVPDKKKAMEWYRKAMELGDSNAEELLKRCKKSTGLGKLMGIFS